MKIFYGWVIVGVGIVVTCVGFGAMLSLSVFLAAHGRGHGLVAHRHRAAGLLNFLGMGLGAFMWGALSDRFGTRAVVLCGGALLGLGMVLASQATTLLQFQLLYGAIVGLAAGSFYAPLTATTTRWFTRAPQPGRGAGLGGAEHGLDGDGAARALADHHLRLAHRHAGSSAISCGS